MSHDLSEGDVEQRLQPVVRAALAQLGWPPDAPATLVNVSENATYRVEHPGGTAALRVHRRGYHDEAAILSELDWTAALRAEAGVRTPRVLGTPEGRRVLTVPEPGAPEPRHVVAFAWLDGAEPDPSDADLPAWFGRLGALTARLHRHARSWASPAGFSRFAWDWDGAHGSIARWGRWQEGLAVGPAEREVLGRLEQVLQARLSAFGADRDRFGLTHADLRLANLLVEGDRTSVIDFDDCGTGWYLYDFGTSVSFFEDDPRVPELADAWATGYRGVHPLPAADEAELPTFVLLRRLLLMAWIGSHAGTDLARSTGAAYTAGSCALAETYLSRFG